MQPSGVWSGIGSVDSASFYKAILGHLRRVGVGDQASRILTAASEKVNTLHLRLVNTTHLC